MYSLAVNNTKKNVFSSQPLMKYPWVMTTYSLFNSSLPCERAFCVISAKTMVQPVNFLNINLKTYKICQNVALTSL